MARRSIRGATAAAILPSALLSAVLVGAPFAGTTTAPLLADRTASASAPAAGSSMTVGAAAAQSAGSTQAGSTGAASTSGATRTGERPGTADDPATFDFRVSRQATVVLLLAWAMLAGVGLAVVARVARRAE